MGTYVAGTESPGTGIPATSETAASAKKSSARKNNTFDNFIMFGRVEMIKERRYEWMWRRVVTEASSCVWQGNQHFYTWLRATFDVATRRNNDCEWGYQKMMCVAKISGGGGASLVK